MKEKYIRRNKNDYIIVKANKIYAKVQDPDEAIFLRDLLVENDWNLDLIDEIYEYDGDYLILGAVDERIFVLNRSETKPSQKTISQLLKNKTRNPNNSRYGLNITRVFDTFIIKKQIAGDDYIFGYYDSLEDAEFVRNHLLDNMWNVNAFSQIHYDEEKDDYKVTEVIDDKVYVLGSFKRKEDIDLPQLQREFLNRITKHKLGLASHDYLNELTGKIPDLERRFETESGDDVWDFKNTSNPLNDIIFNLTPFQKIVYDVIDNSTVEDIEKSLIRFKSKNFTGKILKNLDELEKMGLIRKNQNHYIKVNS